MFGCFHAIDLLIYFKDSEPLPSLDNYGPVLSHLYRILVTGDAQHISNLGRFPWTLLTKRRKITPIVHYYPVDSVWVIRYNPSADYSVQYCKMDHQVPYNGLSARLR